MGRVARLGFAFTFALAVGLSWTSLALAHAGEEHTDPLNAILHQGESALPVVVITLVIVGAIVWWKGRRGPEFWRNTED